LKLNSDPEVRLIKLEVHDAYTNMAIDEALCRLRAKDKAVNTLRLYRWNPSAVSVGYFQNTLDEVDLDACKKFGVDVVRRMTGGGAVYHDYNGEVTYSLILKEGDLGIPSDIIKSYEIICRGLVLAIRSLGLEAEFKPVNDVQIRNRKVSGSAQTRRWGVMLQHGTLLVERMFQVLKVSKEKISDKLIKSVEERVTTLNRELNRKVDFTEISEALERGFSEALNVDLIEAKLTREEMELAKKLREMKYAKKEWILERPKGKLFNLNI